MTQNIKKCLLITLISLFFSSHVNIKAYSRITLAEKTVYNPFKTYYFNYESCLWIICQGHIMTDDSISFTQMTVVAWQTCRGIETSGFLKHCVIQFQLQVDHQRTQFVLSISLWHLCYSNTGLYSTIFNSFFVLCLITQITL